MILEDDVMRSKQVTRPLGPELTESDLRAALDAAVHESLPLVSAGLSLLFAIFAIGHALVLPKGVAKPMIIVASATTLALIGLRLLLTWRPVSPDWAHPIGAGIAGLVLLNSLLHLYLLSDPQQTTNLMLLVIGAGYFFLSSRWLAVVLAATLAGWGLIAWNATPSPAWLHFGFALFTATVLSVLIHSARLRTFRRLEMLRLQDGRRKAELEAALASTEEARQAAEASKRSLEEMIEVVRQSEERFRRFTNLEGIAVHDQGVILDANPALAKIFGCELEELIGRKISEFTAPESRDTLLGRILSGYEQPYEVTGLRKDGTTFPMEIYGQPVPYQGRLVRVAVIRDISERKRAEEALRESEERYRTVAETASDVIITIDQESTILFVNRAAEKTFGYPTSALLGQKLTLLMPEYLRYVHQTGIKRYLETGQRHIAWERTELPGLHQSGKEISLEISFGESIQNGQHIFTGVVRDITERKRAEEERAQLLTREQAARREAEAASRLKDEFVATVSHELRTPLTSMLGWAKMLRAGKLDEVRAGHALEAIERNAQAQAQLIEDLLDISRIVRGQIRLEVETLELAPVIAAAIDAVRPAVEAKAIRLQIALDPEAGLISGDSHRLQQVVWNLLSNAAKFTPVGGRIEVKLERVGVHAQVTVSDTGQGIAPEFLPHVFERFRQADASTTRTTGGLGLGLAIVRHLVELHGGMVSADSRGVGQGATFTVRLPLTQLRIADLGLQNPEAESWGSQSAFRIPHSAILEGVHVLVVDDESDTCEMLAEALAQWGAEVRSAASAAGALTLLEGRPPDVLVSDIGMPGEDGYDLIRQVRARAPELGGLIPAVALTAYAGLEDRRRALAAGYQLHIAKPVEPAELVAAVAQLAGRAGRSEGTAYSLGL